MEKIKGGEPLDDLELDKVSGGCFGLEPSEVNFGSGEDAVVSAYFYNTVRQRRIPCPFCGAPVEQTWMAAVSPSKMYVEIECTACNRAYRADKNLKFLKEVHY